MSNRNDLGKRRERLFISRERERANPSFPRIQKSGNDADDDDDDDDIANSVIFMNHSL